MEPNLDVLTEVNQPTVDQQPKKSLEELKTQYLGLCSHLGEKKLHISLLSGECLEVETTLKELSKELFPLLQTQAATPEDVKHV